MKKTIYSDQWGEITQHIRYRGKKGRFVSYKYGKRNERRPHIKKEVSEWRTTPSGFKEKIAVYTPTRYMKTSYPGSVADNEGNIYDTLRDTNVLAQIHNAQRALINIRGQTVDGQQIRIQSEITLGKHHQDKQITMAIREALRDEGFRTNYSLSIIRGSGMQRARRDASALQPLIDTQFSVVMYA